MGQARHRATKSTTVMVLRGILTARLIARFINHSDRLNMPLAAGSLPNQSLPLLPYPSVAIDPIHNFHNGGRMQDSAGLLSLITDEQTTKKQFPNRWARDWFGRSSTRPEQSSLGMLEDEVGHSPPRYALRAITPTSQAANGAPAAEAWRRVDCCFDPFSRVHHDTLATCEQACEDSNDTRTHSTRCSFSACRRLPAGAGCASECRVRDLRSKLERVNALPRDGVQMSVC
ncbi:hypothetical protein B0I37DRAFT_101567 [Chaetomium sp. MPI-CAGE-AT-0009]|nr:hypothetical protein B0I37DRAFT_101567 [Chaetomium sp. MPI-CAGE-AT-0009]